MSLSPEAVSQSIFIAALFLMLISVPKLALLTIWTTYKMLLFRNLPKVVRSKPLRNIGTSEELAKRADDPKLQLEITTEAYADFREGIRDPLIEAATSLIILGILPFFSPVFPDYSMWMTVALVIIVAVLIAVFATAYVLWRDVNRILVVNGLKTATEGETTHGA